MAARTKWHIYVKRLWRLKFGVVGAIILIVIVSSAIFAPQVAPHDPYDQDIIMRLKPPAWMEGGASEFLLGTDTMGRDILSRLIYGARISLLTGTISVLFSMSIGVFLGLISGYYGKTADSAVNMLVNIWLAFPSILLALAVIAVLGPSFVNMIIVLTIGGWVLYTRPVRSEVQSICQQEYITAAKASGMRDRRIIFLHILPNIQNSIVVIASLEVARMIILESFLSFLGVGIQPPTPSWGGMLGEGRAYMLMRWWLAVFPGLAIFVTTISINLVGEALRDLLDPQA